MPDMSKVYPSGSEKSAENAQIKVEKQLPDDAAELINSEKSPIESFVDAINDGILTRKEVESEANLGKNVEKYPFKDTHGRPLKAEQITIVVVQELNFHRFGGLGAGRTDAVLREEIENKQISLLDFFRKSGWSADKSTGFSWIEPEEDDKNPDLNAVRTAENG